MRRSGANGITIGVILMYVFVFAINIAWIGALIWAIFQIVPWIISK